MSDTVRKPRTEYLNIGFGVITLKYRMPIAARVSILHRVSGAQLILFLPILLYHLDQSHTSELSFED
ncbi:succinate dehydrogenase, cytochrome b556 subunit, partial [Burkholderia pseudomallei]